MHNFILQYTGGKFLINIDQKKKKMLGFDTKYVEVKSYEKYEIPKINVDPGLFYLFWEHHVIY